jgi:hypothetical protein
MTNRDRDLGHAYRVQRSRLRADPHESTFLREITSGLHDKQMAKDVGRLCSSYLTARDPVRLDAF